MTRIFYHATLFSARIFWHGFIWPVHLCPCKTHQKWFYPVLADRGFSASPAPHCCCPPELGRTTFFFMLHIQCFDGIMALFDVNGVMYTGYPMWSWTKLHHHSENVVQENSFPTVYTQQLFFGYASTLLQMLPFCRLKYQGCFACNFFNLKLLSCLHALRGSISSMISSWHFFLPTANVNY